MYRTLGSGACPVTRYFVTDATCHFEKTNLTAPGLQDTSRRAVDSASVVVFGGFTDREADAAEPVPLSRAAVSGLSANWGHGPGADACPHCLLSSPGQRAHPRWLLPHR